MVENDYLIQEHWALDRRFVWVRVLEKGLKICQHIHALYDRHLEALGESTLGETDMEAVNKSLLSLERFWAHNLACGARMPGEQMTPDAALTDRIPHITRGSAPLRFETGR